MKGFIIQVSKDEFLNWQGMATPNCPRALFFLTEEAAADIAKHYEGSTVVPYESTSAETRALGTFFTYHAAIG